MGLSLKNGWQRKSWKVRIMLACCLQGDEVDYVVVRCSDGAITNLHLNNKARLFEELSLAPSVREELFCRSITA